MHQNVRNSFRWDPAVRWFARPFEEVSRLDRFDSRCANRSHAGVSTRMPRGEKVSQAHIFERSSASKLSQAHIFEHWHVNI